jgi:hypothetical protein
MTASSSLAPPATSADPPADTRIAAWLHDGPAQLRSGAHAGAVAGTLDAAGDVSYVYPEIAGYYLQWLAWRARTFGATPALVARAAGVQRWLAVWLARGETPGTRVFLDGTTGDWRNDAVFFFDVAMVARGLGSAAQMQLLAPDTGVVAGVSRQLERLIAADGLYAACARNANGAELPDRWSTRRGGFLAKAAAGIVTSAPALPGLSVQAVAAARATFDASLDWLQARPHREAHPLLYTFEGVMALPGHRRFDEALTAVAAQYDALLAHAAPDGALPETLDGDAGAGPARVDVLAQALRIGFLLNAHRPRRPVDRIALARLAQLLAKQVRPSGAVGFAIRPAGAQANVWAAMFADQALVLAKQPREPGAWWRGDPLLV